MPKPKVTEEKAMAERDARVRALLAACDAVLEWERHTGGWEAPCWNELRKAVRRAKRDRV